MSFNSQPHDLILQNINGLLSVHRSWKRISLSLVAHIINGYAFKSSYFNVSYDGVPLIRIRDVLKGHTSTYYSGVIPDGYWVKMNDIIVGMDGDFNISYWKSQPALLNQRVCKIEIIDEWYDKKFLFHILPGYLEAINANTSSTTVKHLSSKTLQEMLLPLPPITEQKVIAEKLDTLLAQIDNTKARLEQIPQILKRFRQAVLVAAVSGKLTEEWRNNNVQTSVDVYLNFIQENRNKLKRQKKLKQKFGEHKEITPLFSFGMDQWKWVSFSQICANDNNALKAGPFGSALKKSDCIDYGYKVYGQEQVISGNESLETYFISAEKYKQLDSCAIAPKDILISLVGTIGKVLILSEKASDGIINPRLVKISLQEDIDRKYIKYYLDSPIAHGFFKGFSHGGTMEILNLGILKELPIPFPPLEEQTEIVCQVEQLFAYADAIEKQTQNALERVNSLTQSILAKAFRGELTEQWRAENPNLISGENSAEALFAKIKAEREAVKPKKQTRKKV